MKSMKGGFSHVWRHFGGQINKGRNKGGKTKLEKQNRVRPVATFLKCICISN